MGTVMATKESGPVAEAIATAKQSCADFRTRAKNNVAGQRDKEGKPMSAPKLTAALVEKFVRQALEPHKEAILTAAIEQVAISVGADPD